MNMMRLDLFIYWWCIFVSSSNNIVVTPTLYGSMQYKLQYIMFILILWCWSGCNCADICIWRWYIVAVWHRQKYTSGNFFMIFLSYWFFSTLFQFCTMRRKVKHKKIIVCTTKIKFPFPHPAELKFKFELVLTQCISRYD